MRTRPEAGAHPYFPVASATPNNSPFGLVRCLTVDDASLSATVTRYAGILRAVRIEGGEGRDARPVSSSRKAHTAPASSMSARLTSLTHVGSFDDT